MVCYRIFFLSLDFLRTLIIKNFFPQLVYEGNRYSQWEVLFYLLLTYSHTFLTQTLAGDQKGSDGDSDNSSVDLEEVDDAVESHPPSGDDTDDEEEDGSNKLSESDALEKDVGTDVNFKEEADVARKVLKNLLASSKGSIASPDCETEESDKSKLKNSSTKPVADSSGVSEPLKSGKTKEVAPKETQENEHFERTLFIRNIPFDVTKEEVKQKFAVFGEVESLFLVLNKVTKYAFLYALKFIQSLKQT